MQRGTQRLTTVAQKGPRRVLSTGQSAAAFLASHLPADQSASRMNSNLCRDVEVGGGGGRGQGGLGEEMKVDTKVEREKERGRGRERMNVGNHL